MSKTLKQKVWHILFNKDGVLNLKVPRKLRWSYFNKIRRVNFDRDEERIRLAQLRDKISKADMKQQIKEL